MVIMAKPTRSHSKNALAEGEVTFNAGGDRFSIGLTSRETNLRMRTKEVT